MKSLQWRISALLLLALSAAAACAQVAGGFIGAQVSGGFTGMKGVPFSADIINESTQTLADGNRVHHETKGRIFRDSEGRTRNETELLAGSAQVRIIIQDPVEQIFIHLDPQNKIARIQHFPKPLIQPSVGQGAGAGVAVGAGRAGAASPFKPSVDAPHQPKPVMTTEKLESREMEGFTVYGTRRTRTIEAGQEGNDKPITAVNEVWYSPDLKTALLTTQDDPRSGRNIMRLTNIRLGEPDPLLFQVPPDYTVKDISNQ